MAGVVSKQPVKETTFPLQAEEPGTEGKQPDVKTDAYDLADTDLTVWYEDPSYEDFFEYAARQYFEQTGVKAAFKCQDTLDYIGMIYDFDINRIFAIGTIVFPDPLSLYLCI